MYQIKNTSSSTMNIEGRSVAPTQSINLPQVSLVLRSFEERGFLQIQQIEEIKPAVKPKLIVPLVKPVGPVVIPVMTGPKGISGVVS